MAQQKQIQVQAEKTTRAPRTHRAPKGTVAPIAPAAQEAAQQEAAQQEAAQQSAVLGYFVNINRPTAGARLFAHTAAFLALSGMSEGKAYPRGKATQVIGPVAVKYHLDPKQGNFEATENGLVLTEKGKITFSARKVDPEMLKAYRGILSTGKADGSIVKSDAHIKAIS